MPKDSLVEDIFSQLDLLLALAPGDKTKDPGIMPVYFHFGLAQKILSLIIKLVRKNMDEIFVPISCQNFKKPDRSNNLIRLVLVGDGFVGKTSMIVR